jgi:hypothetical protein
MIERSLTAFGRVHNGYPHASAPQQEYQQQTMSAGAATNLMYQSAQFPTSSQPQIQQSAMSRPAMPSQPYASWMMGGAMAKGLSFQRHGMLEANGQSRPMSMTAASMRNLGMQAMPRAQSDMIQQPAMLNAGMSLNVPLFVAR